MFDEFTVQKPLFDHMALPLVEDVLRGKNGKIYLRSLCHWGEIIVVTWCILSSQFFYVFLIPWDQQKSVEKIGLCVGRYGVVCLVRGPKMVKISPYQPLIFVARIHPSMEAG